MNTNKRSYYIGDCENLIFRLKTVYTLTFTLQYTKSFCMQTFETPLA
jgi:hypothetical protein